MSDENIVTTLTGTFDDTQTGLLWNLSSVAYEPSTEYILCRDKGLGKTLVVNNEYQQYWTNEGTIIRFTTPSVADAGLASLEFQAPVFGQFGKDEAYTEGTPVSYIRNIEIALKDLRYEFNDHQRWVAARQDAKFQIYNVTDGTDKLAYEGNVGITTRETTMYYYQVVNLAISQNFYEDQKYKIVIPKDALTVNDELIKNFITSPEWVLEFEGATPTEVRVKSCTIEDGMELSALPVVVWNFDGAFDYDSELRATLHVKRPGLTEGTFIETDIKRETRVTNGTNSTTVYMINYDSTTGLGYPLRTDWEYTVILPEGLLYYATEPSIKNKELTYSIKPVEVVETVDYVNLSVSVNGLATVSQPAVMDKKVTLTLAPTADWKVSKLTRNGSDVLDFVEDGEYETPALTEDTAIEATVEYDGEWAVESTTGVWEIADRGISIRGEEGKIVVSGVSADDTIMVYGVNGILIDSAKADAGADTVSISVAAGQVYIVTVDGKAAKIQM